MNAVCAEAALRIVFLGADFVRKALTTNFLQKAALKKPIVKQRRRQLKK